jgi:hypothetical protein
VEGPSHHSSGLCFVLYLYAELEIWMYIIELVGSVLVVQLDHV